MHSRRSKRLICLVIAGLTFSGDTLPEFVATAWSVAARKFVRIEHSDVFQLAPAAHSFNQSRYSIEQRAGIPAGNGNAMLAAPDVHRRGMGSVACFPAIPSRHFVDETVSHLERALRSKGIVIFVLVDHSGEAQRAGPQIRFAGSHN